MKLPFCKLCEKPVEKLLLYSDSVLLRKVIKVVCHDDYEVYSPPVENLPKIVFEKPNKKRC